MSQKECQTCGRGDGHWVGCAETRAPRPAPGAFSISVNDEVLPITAASDDSVLPLTVEPAAKPETLCEYGECPHDKRPQGKGPKPRYCEDHSTQKSRK